MEASVKKDLLSRSGSSSSLSDGAGVGGDERETIYKGLSTIDARIGGVCTSPIRMRLNSANSAASVQSEGSSSVVPAGPVNSAFYDSDYSAGSIIFCGAGGNNIVNREGQNADVNAPGGNPVSQLPYHQRRLLRNDNAEAVEIDTTSVPLQNTGQPSWSPTTHNLPRKQLSRPPLSSNLPSVPHSNPSRLLPSLHHRTFSSDKPPLRRNPPSTASPPHHSQQPSKGRAQSGNSQLLTSLTSQLAKDVANFFHRESPSPNHSRNSSFDSTGDIDTDKLNYHNKNQAFLAEQEKIKPKPRPIYSSSPPASYVHRPKLPSIDNDDWENDFSQRTASDNKPDKQLPQEQPLSHYQKIIQRNQLSKNTLATIPSSKSLLSSISSNTETIGTSNKSTDDNQNQPYIIPTISRHQSKSFSSSSTSSSDDDNINDYPDDTITEKTSLLPPSGISTQETYQTIKSRPQLSSMSLSSSTPNKSRRSSSSSTKKKRSKNSKKSRDHSPKPTKSKRKHHKKSRRNRRSSSSSYSSPSSSSSTSDSKSRRRRLRERKKLEKERQKFLQQMKAEWKAEAYKEFEAQAALFRQQQLLQQKQQQPREPWFKPILEQLYIKYNDFSKKFTKFLNSAEAALSNLPLTIGAIAYSFFAMGTVWFKFAEEMMDSCVPVHFHSAQCTFPEYPGCFYCDKSSHWYQVAVFFHYFCSSFSGILAMSFLGKCIVAPRVVVDEMSSPTTASPAGLICMTLACVFAGRGLIGRLIVGFAASIHLIVVMWFIYMALAYHILPEPSWYPNTTSIGICAVKSWLYYPVLGHFLMAISLSLTALFFPISLIRTFLNEKISSPVSFMQVSAPSVALYALTLMAQPTFEEEHPDVTAFQEVHRLIYLPFMHLMFFLTLVGAASSIHSFVVRWKHFREKPFSPAHAAFCCPSLTHANAIQAYRSSVNAFSTLPQNHPYKIFIFCYWTAVLVCGTIATIIIASKYLLSLPSWIQVDVEGEEEPPQPNETTMCELISTGEEILNQPYVSPAVLQANETGLLLRLPRSTAEEEGKPEFIRTRRVPALGFEPTMNWSEMCAERELLLDWVEKHPPRTRKRTLSVPGIDFHYGYGDFGTDNLGVYDAEMASGNNKSSRNRAGTFDVGLIGRRRNQPDNFH